MSGNDWGGVELMEKLNLMEMAGIGYGSLSCWLMLDSKMNPKEATESPTFLLPSFSDFF